MVKDRGKAKEDAEKRQFVDFLNQLHESGTVLFTGNRTRLQVDDQSLFDEVSKGVLLARLMNYWEPQIINMKKIKVKDTKEQYADFELNLNNETVIEACRDKNMKMVNVGATDISQGNKSIIMSLLWQIIEQILIKQVKDAEAAMAGDGVSENLSPEELITRWFNFVLEKCNTDKRISNLHSDLSDCEAYAHILHAMSPEKFDYETVQGVLGATRAERKAQRIIDGAYSVLGASTCIFVSADDIVDGAVKMNFAFAAVLFGRRSMLPESFSQVGHDADATPSGAPSLGALRKGTNGCLAEGIWITEGPTAIYQKGSLKWEHKSTGKLLIEMENGDSISLTRSDIQVIPCTIWDIGFAVTRGGPYKLSKTGTTVTTPTIYVIGIDEDETADKFEDLKAFLDRCKVFSLKPQEPPPQ